MTKERIEKLVGIMNRYDKVYFLQKIGLFRRESLWEMNDKQIDELVATALEVKGY